ncbi:MAG: MFS transporter [Acidobacteriaceae bacterium]|nr:MFS transporter [Acidobacteriaceae bacterium]
MTQATTPRDITRAWWATVALFLVHGLVVSTWLSRIPAVQSALRLNNGVLGLTFLCAAIGAVVTIPLAGWLVTRYGSRRVSASSSLLFPVVISPLPFASSAPMLAAALFVYGATAATMDVSMNAHGVEVEKAMRKPTMSRFHGMFSLGGMAGAGIGSLAAARAVAPRTHFAIAAVVCFLLVLMVRPLLLRAREAAHPTVHRLPLSQIPAVLLALSAIGFCILLSEGAMADWTAVYFKQVLRSGPGTAAAGYSVFSAAMAAFRFMGDLITARLGPLRTVRAGSLVAACGLLWSLSLSAPSLSLLGFGAVGAGLSVIIPLVFGSGGRVENVSPGAGIATVTGIGYIGFLVGPPLIGFLSQLFTLRYALGVVVACCLIAALLSGSLGRLRSPAAEPLPELHL